MKHGIGRKLLSVVLAVMMLVSLLPTAAFADDSAEPIVVNSVVGDSNTGNDTKLADEALVNVGDTNANEGEGEETTPVSTPVAKIGNTGYATLDDAITAVKDGETIEVNAGEYTLNGSLNYTGKAFTIAAADGADVSFDMSAAVALHGAKITFNNVTFNYKTNGNYIGLQHTDTLVYNNCTINGMVFLYAVNETFNNCTFNQTETGAYNVWTYGAKNVVFNSCVFNCAGRCVLVYTEDKNANTALTVADSAFYASASVVGKAAIEIDTSLMKNGGATVTVGNTIATGFANGSNSGNPLWNDKKQTADTNKNTTVTVDDVAVFEPVATAAVAKIGETEYETLAAAIEAAKDGETVKLLADATEDVVINKNITLDLGGKTLTNTNAGKATVTIAKGATATVQNGSIIGGTSYYNIQNNGTATFKDVTATAGNTDSSMIDNWGTLTINSGSYTGGLDTIKNEPGAKLTITGGDFTLTKGTSKGFTGVVFNYGDLTITGGTFTQSDKSAPYGQAQVIHTDKSGSSAPSTVIKGGTFKNLCTRSTAWTVRIVGADYSWIEVSGGTFNKSVSESYCADGFIPTKNADGTYGVKEGKYVAEISSKKYETLADAIRLAAKGKTITLLDNVTENVEIKANKNLTLDLNGFTLNGGTGTAKAALSNLGTITIQDTSAAKTGTIKRDDKGTTGETSYYVINNKGTMTIESGTVINNSGYRKANSTGSMVGSSLICNGDDDALAPVLNIEGGKFVQENFIAIKNGLLGTLNVSGGEISSKHSAIQNWYKATITGGTINGQLWTDAFVWAEGTSIGETKIGGNAEFNGEIVMDITGTNVIPKLEITDGELNVTKWNITTAAANAGAKPAVSGGKFTSAVPENYCAEGFIPTKNADGTYGVKAGAYAAQIGDVKYETLQAAINAANTNDTVKLLADATEDVTINKDITLDLNGKTLTNTGAGKATVTIAKGATATVQNGSIIGDTSYYNIQNNGTATFKDVTATAGNTGSSMLDNWGTLTIESGTYEGGLNVVKSEEGSTLTINGGKFTGTYAPSSGYTAVILVYGNTTITGGEFIQSLTTTGSWAHPQVVMTGVVEGYEAFTTVTGGTFTNKKSGEGIFRGLGKATSDNFEVSGGTFNKSVSDSFFKEGYFAKKTADGYTADGPYAVRIGTTAGYATLEEAFAAANTGDTITLLRDCESDRINLETKSITVDLNGKVLTSTAAYGVMFCAKNGHKITVKGTTAGSKLVGTLMVTAETDGRIEINGGTYESDKYCPIYINGAVSSENSKLTVKNATITALSGDSNQDNGVAVYLAGYSTSTFTKTTITAPVTGLEIRAGKLTLTNCTVTGGSGEVVTNANGNGTTVTNAAVAISQHTTKKNIDVTITGGTYTATAAVYQTNVQGTGSEGVKASIKSGTFKGAVSAETNNTVAVSGGSFSSAVPENCCAPGYIPTKNEDSTYGVKQGTYVAETKGVKYETLQAAIDAAVRNATVKMLADTRENVTIDKAMTLDLNGHTLNGGTVKGTPTLKIDTARVTVMDSSEAKTGTIMREDTAENSGVSSHYVIDIQGRNALLTFNSGNVRNNSGNADGSKGASLVRVGDDNNKKVHPVLTIAGGTFTQDNFIVIKVDFGTLHLKGGTVNSKTSYAVENWLNANIKGDAVVNGAVSSWTYSAGSNSTLEISGGTVNGNVESVSYDGAEGKLAKVKITGGTVNGTLSTKRYNNATAPSKDMATIEVTGGTFDRDPTKYVVEGSTVNANSDGTFGVAKAYLAKVGETSYYTMDEAFKAQTASGAPIVMLRDYTTGSTFNSGTVARVVDLRGHTWTCTGTDANSAAFEINNPNATLTVKNGKIVSSQLVGLIPSAMGGTIKYDNSSLTFENVEMSTTATSGIETNGNNTNDTVTLKNSTLNVPNGFGIYFPSSGTLTIDNSTINAKTMGVQVCAGSLSINEGSKITVTGDPVEKTENDGAIQDGAAISIVNRGYKPFGEIAITGGTFTAKAGNNAIKAYNWDNTNKVETTFTANDKVAVSGGTFSSAVPAGLCAEGYVPTEADANGNYTVEKVMVAQIGEVKYGTLAEAIAAANAGDTVKLLRDINTPEISYMISKSLTIDLNGKTVTGDGYDAVFQINNADAKVLIKNGNIVAIENTGSAGKYAMAIWACKAECEVTLENLNVSQKITHTDDPQMDMIYASGGTIIINSGNFESGTPAWTLNCKDAAYKAGTANIIVKGGTFTGFDPANNKAEGENTNFVAAGYKSVDNGNGTYTVIVNEAVVAVIGTKEYATLSEALKDAAKNGGTVLLVADVDANEDLVRVKHNVTLDLNGHSITNADMLYVNGQIKDSASVKGIVSAVDYEINDLNAYTPVYNSTEKGYSFFDLGMNSRWDTAENKAKFALKKTNDRAAAVALMVASADDRRVKAVVTFSWEEQGTIVEQSFTFLDAKLSDYLTTVPANQLYVVVNGLDQFTAHVDMQTKFVICKENGAELFTLAGESSPVNY